MPGFKPTNAISKTFLFPISFGVKDGEGSAFQPKSDNVLAKIHENIHIQSIFAVTNTQ
jgi:hypothetical protein